MYHHRPTLSSVFWPSPLTFFWEIFINSTIYKINYTNIIEFSLFLSHLIFIFSFLFCFYLFLVRFFTFLDFLYWVLGSTTRSLSTRSHTLSAWSLNKREGDIKFDNQRKINIDLYDVFLQYIILPLYTKSVIPKTGYT